QKTCSRISSQSLKECQIHRSVANRCVSSTSSTYAQSLQDLGCLAARSASCSPASACSEFGSVLVLVLVQYVCAGGDGGHGPDSALEFPSAAERSDRRRTQQETRQQVSLGLFDDIIIPPESLQQPAKFDEAEQLWVWEYETDEGAHDLFMDRGEDIRFRVVDEVFIDTSPTGPSTEKEAPSAATAPPAGAEDSAPQKEAPYTLIVRILDIAIMSI
uniref:DNA-directed RNA polymerase III subunit RPC8-like n=1 Tax=Sinocyclocheilus anshuiensis TaxID=1608454 RepID=A0A671R2L0_9TELE